MKLIKKSTFFEISFLCFLIITSILIRIRAFRFPFFSTDSFNDYLVGHYMITDKLMPLTGPNNSLLENTGIYNSPLYYYIIHVILILNDNIISLYFFNFILQIFVVLLIYLITKSIFGPATAVTSSLLYALYTPSVNYSQYLSMWSLSLVFFNLSIFFLILTYKKRGTIFAYLCITSFVLAGVLHFSSFSLFFIFPFLLFYILYKIGETKEIIKITLLSCTILITSIFPSILYAFINNAFNFGILTNQTIFSKKFNLESPFHTISDFITYILPINKNPLMAISVAIIVTTSAYYLLKTKQCVSKKAYIILLSFIVIPIFILSFSASNNIHSHNYSFIIGILSISIMVPIGKLFLENKQLFFIGVIFSSIIIYTLSSNLYYLRHKQFVDFTVQTKAAKEIKNEIYLLKKYNNPHLTSNFFDIAIAQEGIQKDAAELIYPLEQVMNIKIAKLDDKENEDIVHINKNSPFLFLACKYINYEYTNQIKCLDTYRHISSSDGKNYGLIKSVYEEYPFYRIFLLQNRD